MLNKEELTKVVESIRLAEGQTSAEIRVCVARKCTGNPLDAALEKFKSLKMEKTALRNGVLIYVAPADHKAAIIGDTAVDELAKSGFWDSTLDGMFAHFRENRICDGICYGVGRVGELIKGCFPIMEDDINELCDDVILDEE